MEERQPIIIYGAGGMGREIAAMIRVLKVWQVKGFLDDSLSIDTLVDNIPVIGNNSALEKMDGPVDLILAIGDPLVKRNVHQRLPINRVRFPSLVHPSAIIQSPETITLGAGVIVTAGCVLTTGIEIGDQVLLNLNVTIGHDAHIGAFTSVMPGVNIAGMVRIGEEVLVGSGANIINGVEIGNRTRIGAGAVVIDHLPPNVTAVGVPARFKKGRD